MVCVIFVSYLFIVSVVGYEVDIMISDYVVDICVVIFLVVVEFVSLNSEELYNKVK